MVNVGVVCVRMFQPLVPVWMRVGFAGGIVWRVLVLMMFVVSVRARASAAHEHAGVCEFL